MKMVFKTLALIFSFAVFFDSAIAEEKIGQQITRSAEHTIHHAPTTRFSGEAHFSHFPLLSSTGAVAPAIVNFEAGTITNWHIHPHGQYLIVIEGEGRTQEWGQPIQVILEGDVVWCPPGVKHWHGGGENTAMSHIAISPVIDDGKQVQWLERVELPDASNTKITFPPSPSVVTLSEKQLSLIPIAAYSAIGDMEKLKSALEQGMQSGLSVNEIKELFAHQYAYAGFPRALNGMLSFKALLEERRHKGIMDIEGPEPTEATDNVDYYQRGNHVLSYLRQTPLEENSSPLFNNFSPTMDYALKAHLFGYLFSRDNLGYVERELVVLSTLAALGGVNPQLRSHLRIAQNIGVGPKQMQKVLTVLGQTLEPDVAANVQDVFNNLK